MIINITKGIGAGRTKISAFDNALHSAGIANYNLIYLSSIIPDNAIIARDKPKPNKSMGNKLYVVMAEAYSTIPGKWAWAGLGWILLPDGGLFVEATGESNEEVKTYIKQSLEDMEATRSYNNNKIEVELTGAKCNGIISCALVAAIYQEKEWK